MVEEASQFNEDFMKIYDENTLFDWDNGNAKTEKLVANLHDKEEYFIHIRNLKHRLNHRLVLKKVDRGIKFNQKAWLKSYIDMNT